MADRMVRLVLLLLALGATAGATARDAGDPVAPMRERAARVDALLAERVRTVLPEIMRRSAIDTWVLISREYNEDPVLRTFLPATWLSARRRTILLIHDPGPGHELETLAVARYAVGDLFAKAWDKESQPHQWARLVELLVERDPQAIGINVSETFALADGLSHTEHALFMEHLPVDLRARVVSAEALAIGWLETRTATEMEHYQALCRLAHDLIAEAFSNAVVQPGMTTTDDVAWWLRDRVRGLGLSVWFHPSVSIQRADGEAFDHLEAFSSGLGNDRVAGGGQDRLAENVIRPGDLLHVDFGITYLRLNTDTQQHAYVLRPNESDAPEELKAALTTGNRLQDILTNAFVAGRSGNEILAAALAEAARQGINASIYTHPIGYHGHAAGPTIGLWDQQDGVPGKGDYPLYPATAHSIELNAAVDLEAWNGKGIRIMLEEDAFFDGETTRYIDGRQRHLHLIRSTPINR